MLVHHRKPCRFYPPSAPALRSWCNSVPKSRDDRDETINVNTLLGAVGPPYPLRDVAYKVRVVSSYLVTSFRVSPRTSALPDVARGGSRQPYFDSFVCGALPREVQSGHHQHDLARVADGLVQRHQDSIDDLEAVAPRWVSRMAKVGLQSRPPNARAFPA